MGASRATVIGYAAYAAGALVFGEVWPFSRFPMYAHNERDSVVPVFLVDGVPTRPEAMRHIHGCRAEDVEVPPHTPFRVGWRLDEIRAHFRREAADTPGDVPVTLGLAMIRTDLGEPTLDDQLIVLCTGTARRAP